MIGRGTRLCEDLFGPDQDKEFFRVFDYCQNLEFFGANPELKEAGSAKSLSERLFAARIDFVRALDEKGGNRPGRHYLLQWRRGNRQVPCGCHEEGRQRGRHHG